MAVAFDNNAGASVFGTSVTTAAFTISGSNRVAVTAFGRFTALTNIVVTCAGVTGTLITGAEVADLIGLYQHIAPATGSQTASASWTETASASVGATTMTGVDQTTPANNGTSASGASPQSLSVTSTSGDLTVTGCIVNSGETNHSSDQTNKNTGIYGNTDIGPGTGTTTHIWTRVGDTMRIAGANIVAVAVAGWGPLLGLQNNRLVVAA